MTTTLALPTTKDQQLTPQHMVPHLSPPDWTQAAAQTTPSAIKPKCCTIS